MLLQSLTPTFSIPNFHMHHLRRNDVALNVSRVDGRISLPYGRFAITASNVQSSSFNVEKKRKVVEHICLLKAKQDLSKEDENDMLDYLYTSQYQMRGILAVSLGRISSDTVENYTHAVFMRFQRKEDVTKFYENPFYLKVLKEHVMPYCHVRPDIKLADIIKTFWGKGKNIICSELLKKQMWKTKFKLIIKKTLPIHFSVDPVGEEIM
eukprot:XP_015578244.1 uncharacterized protein LOC107261700 [Ricinus communis]